VRRSSDVVAAHEHEDLCLLHPTAKSHGRARARRRRRPTLLRPRLEGDLDAKAWAMEGKAIVEEQVKEHVKKAVEKVEKNTKHVAAEVVDSIRKPLNSMIAKVAEGATAETDVIVETSHDIRRILKGTESVATGAVERAKDTAAYLRKINTMTKKLTPVLKHAADAAQVCVCVGSGRTRDDAESPSFRRRDFPPAGSRRVGGALSARFLSRGDPLVSSFIAPHEQPCHAPAAPRRISRCRCRSRAVASSR